MSDASKPDKRKTGYGWVWSVRLQSRPPPSTPLRPGTPDHRRPAWALAGTLRWAVRARGRITRTLLSQKNRHGTTQHERSQAARHGACAGPPRAIGLAEVGSERRSIIMSKALHVVTATHLAEVYGPGSVLDHSTAGAVSLKSAALLSQPSRFGLQPLWRVVG